MLKNKKIKILLIIIQTISSYLLSVYMIYNHLAYSLIFKPDIFLFILLWIISFFIISYLIFPIKKVNNFIFEKRYFLALILFLVLVLGKFNGSSYGMWDTYIEPNYPVASLNPIVGKKRGIRSDEWLVNSSHVLSQFKNNFNYFNDLARASNTDMFTTLPVPVKSIMIVTKPFLIGYLFLGKDYGMAFYWWSRLIVLFLVTFEFFRIFTKDKRSVSLLGAVLVTFSPAIFWWYSQYLIEQLIGANIAIIMFYKMLHTKEKNRKILYSLGIFLGFSMFFFTLYPAWLVPLGYFYLLLASYILYDYHKRNKIKIKDLRYLLIPISMFIIFLIIFFSKSYNTYKIISNTIYPGQRLSVGSEGANVLLYYPFTIFYPYLEMSNPCEASTFYSYFPLVIILGIYVLIKERKKWRDNYLLIGVISLIILFTLFAIFKWPVFLAKITLLSNVPGKRINVMISYLCLFLLILLIDKKFMGTKKEKILFSILTIVCCLITTLLAKEFIKDEAFQSNIIWLISFGISLIPVLCLIWQAKKSLIISLIFISVISTVYVNPLMKGFGGIYDKPLAKELTKYQGKWLVLDSFVIPNYFLANGLKVINSTFVYPNMDFYYKLDENKTNEEIYNRYANLEIKLTNEKTSFENPYDDQVHIKLNKNDVCKLDVNYIGSLTDISNYESEKVSFKELYHLDNIYLYEVNCK